MLVFGLFCGTAADGTVTEGAFVVVIVLSGHEECLLVDEVKVREVSELTETDALSASTLFFIGWLSFSRFSLVSLHVFFSSCVVVLLVLGLTDLAGKGSRFCGRCIGTGYDIRVSRWFDTSLPGAT